MGDEHNATENTTMATEETIEYLKRDTSYLKHNIWHVSHTGPLYLLETSRYIFFDLRNFHTIDEGRRLKQTHVTLSNGPKFHLVGYGPGLWRINLVVWEGEHNHDMVLGVLPDHLFPDISRENPEEVTFARQSSQTWYLPPHLQNSSEVLLTTEGKFPPALLADYLEERWPICPELALQAMRGWVTPKPKRRTNKKVNA